MAFEGSYRKHHHHGDRDDVESSSTQISFASLNVNQVVPSIIATQNPPLLSVPANVTALNGFPSVTTVDNVEFARSGQIVSIKLQTPPTFTNNNTGQVTVAVFTIAAGLIDPSFLPPTARSFSVPWVFNGGTQVNATATITGKSSAVTVITITFPLLNSAGNTGSLPGSIATYNNSF